MILTLTVMLVGLAIGFAMAGATGAALGAVCGVAIGMLLRAVWPSTRRMWPGQEVQRRSVSVMCVPKGSQAECVLVQDAATGRWVDVERCSLAPTEDDVRCPKECLRMMNEKGATARS